MIRGHRSRIRRSSISWVIAAVAVGGLVDLAVGAMLGSLAALLSAILAATALFLVIGWVWLWPMTAARTRADALRDGVNFRVEELFVVVAELVAMVAVAALLMMGKSHGNQIAALMGAVAVFMAWGGLHLVYAMLYAWLYYRRPEPGIDFNSDTPPTYRDFLYFAYNLGMTYQVSDTAVSSAEIRSVVLRHCLLSYIFGTVVLATTVNLFVGFVAA